MQPIETRSLRRLTAGLLIVTPLAFSVFFNLLQANFSYPGILEAAPGEILTRFDAGGSSLIATWYGYVASALLLIPTVLLLHQVIASRSRSALTYLPLTTAIGVLAGLVQVLGLARWVFAVPYLSDLYQNPSTSAGAKESVGIVFQTFNQYAGVGLGEHLGYLLTGVWSILICLALMQVGIAPRWLGILGIVLGIVLAVGILFGDLKLAGFTAAAQINSLSYLVWAHWLITLGVLLWTREPQAETASLAGGLSA